MQRAASVQASQDCVLDMNKSGRYLLAPSLSGAYREVGPASFQQEMGQAGPPALLQARSSVVEHYLDTVGVSSSILLAPTTYSRMNSPFTQFPVLYV